MLTRRGFAGLLLAAPFAFADQSKPELWSGEVIAKAEPKSIVVDGQHVRLHGRAKASETVMLSTSNDNQSFRLWVVMPRQRDGLFQYLKIGNTWWSSHGTGSDNEGTKTTFEIDRAAAKRIAAAFKIPIHERTKLDGGLRYSFRFPPKASTNTQTPIPVVLRVENAGKTTVIGGRQRGPRDNRFVFAIARNGKPVAIKVAHDFGGIGHYKAIKPGEHADVTCPDLRAWADLDVPGYYTIDARYEGELAKDGKMPSSAAERANLWDIVATGQGSILVQ